MGTSFANIHVRRSGRQVVEAALKPKILYKSFYPESYYLAEYEGWISVLGSSLNWETVGEKAMRMSRLLSEPVGAIGCFDDDVLVWAFYWKGQLIQSYASGGEEYEIPEERFDVPALIEMLDLPADAKQLKGIFEDETDPVSLIGQMEDLLQLPLWVKYDWVQDDEELCRSYHPVE